MREGSGCRANSPTDQRQRSYLKRMNAAVDLCMTVTLKHLRLNCEGSGVLFDSEGFISQLDEEGGGTDVPKPGSRPMELLLPWLLTGALV